MRLVTKNTHYAIKSLLYFAQYPDRVVPVNELVKKLNLRRAFLRRILQVLNQHKILKSLKGKGGGFILNVKPSSLCIVNIIEIFRGKINIMGCLLEKKVCSHPNECALMLKVKDIEKGLNKALRAMTIGSSPFFSGKN